MMILKRACLPNWPKSKWSHYLFVVLPLETSISWINIGIMNLACFWRRHQRKVLRENSGVWALLWDNNANHWATLLPFIWWHIPSRKMCAHTDKDSAAISAISFSGTTQIHFTKKSYIKEKKWKWTVCWLYNASYVGSVNIAAVYVCVQKWAGTAGIGETTLGGNGEESEGSLLGYGRTVCPARSHAPAHEGQVGA